MISKLLGRKKENIRKRAVAYLLVGSLVMGLIPMTAAADTAEEETHSELWEANDGNMNIVPYNNEDIRVDVASGGWATPVAADVNGDGIMDLILGSNSTPYPGTLVFYGQEGAQTEQNPDGTPNADYMFMENAVKIGGNAQPNGTSFYEYNAETHMYGDYINTLIIRDGTVYGDASSYPNTSTGYAYSVPRWDSTTAQTYIDILAPYRTVETISGTAKGTLKGSSYGLADYDGDGVEDYIFSADSWGEYGWVYGQDGKYDKETGVWGDGDDPIRSWVFWHKNAGSDLTKAGTNFGEAQLVMVYDPATDTTMPLENFGNSYPQFRDWDADGDLDIICGSFLDDITYYENTGTSQNPKYIVGRTLQTYADDTCETLEALEMNECNLSLTSADWNEDGYMDLIVCVEDGRVALIEHSGTFTDDGTPIMENVKFFQMPAEGVKGGMEFSPFSVDWDEDGDEDIISGNSYGYICFIENLSIKIEDGVDKGSGDITNPSWAKPVPLRNESDDSIYRITAGDTLVKAGNGEYVKGGGSPQGTSEDCWGYTTLTVADWNNDNVLDIMSNNVWGKVYIHYGIAGDVYHVKDAQPVEVEWEDENIYPSWNWWKPEGKELVTVWRTTPFMIDLPLDKDGDGKATGDGLVDLVMLDHEGYLTFFERYESSDGTLKLKEGKRIFKNSVGGQFRLSNGDYGENGRVKFTIVDYNMDDRLDIIYTDSAGAKNVEYAKNISTTPGEYVFSVGDMLHERAIYNHSVSPTVCNWNKETDEAPDLLMGAEDGHMYYLINNVAGQEGETPTPNDYLVAHWDFEDDGTGNALKDKASAGTNADDLTIYDASGEAQATTDITVENGVATVKGDASLRAVDSADLDITGELTIFTRMKVDAIGWYTLASKGTDGTYKLSMAGLGGNGGNGGVFFRHNTFCWSGSAFPTNVWREVATVVDYNADGNMVVQIYISNSTSTSSSSDFTLYKEQVYEGTTALGTNDTPFIIGNINGTNNDATATSTRQFDDFRLYNKALTVEELAEVMPDTSVEESLVAHWDFEDDGADNELKDKATESATADDLTVYNAECVAQETEDISIENGVATIKGGAYLRAEDSVDLNITGELTLLMKVQLSGLPQDIYYLVNKGTLSNAYSVMTNPNSWWGLRHAGGYKFQSASLLPTNQWTTLAVVVRYDSSGDMVLDYYSDVEGGATGLSKVATKDPDVGRKALTVSNAPFYIGNTCTESGADKTTSINITRQYDDVRIYNKALTAEQLAEVYTEDEDDSSLVAHWDFNGTDETTQLADKANGENPLSIGYANATPTGAVTLSDGKATITGDGYLRAAAAGLNITDSMTVFVRAKVDKLDWYKLLSKRSGSNGYEFGTYPPNGMMLTYKENFFANNSIVADEWREMAIVVNKDEDGFYNYEFLMSKNEATADGGDFVSYVKRRTPVAEHVSANTPLTIGNNGTPGSYDATRVFDDIQIYNRALTTDELAALINPSDLDEGKNTTSYYLKSLDNTAGFTFFDYRTDYTAETYKETITITPVAEDAGVVTLQVGTETVTSGASKEIALNEGENTITIKVGVGANVRTYTLKITRNSVMIEKLAALVERVGKYENTGYDAWDAFANVMSQAEALLELTNPSDGEVVDVYNALVAAEQQLFAQENLPAVSLEGFTHVTLEDFGLTSKTYTSDVGTRLSSENSLDHVLISMHVDFQQTGASARIDLGGNGKGIYIYPGSNRLNIYTVDGNVIPDVYHNIPLSTLQTAGLTSTLDKFFMQMSFEYKDYDADGVDDGVQVEMYVNGMKVYSKDMTGCKLSSLDSQLILRVNSGNSVALDSVIGDAHGDGVLDTRDLVAVVKAADGTNLGNTYENTVADVNMTEPVDQTDVIALREKLLK